MKLLILTSIVALCSGRPSVVNLIHPAPQTLLHPVSVQLSPVAPILNQYLSQDGQGHYSYGYRAATSARDEQKAKDGVIRGTYSYVDPNGAIQSVQYESDALNGYRVKSGNLPQAPSAPEDTPEVANARIQHLQAVEAATKHHIPGHIDEEDDKLEEGQSASSQPQPTAEKESKPKDMSSDLPADVSNLVAADPQTAIIEPQYYYPIHPIQALRIAPISSPEVTLIRRPVHIQYRSYPYPLQVAAPVALPYSLPTSSQYHAQDELGQYSYGYSSGLSAKSEARSFDGVTRGAYSYIDSNGELQSVQYVSDAINGFRVAATNLPVAPTSVVAEQIEPLPETPEVIEARRVHEQAHQEARDRLARAEKINEEQ